MKWDGGANNHAAIFDGSDQNMALGNFHVQGIGDLTLKRDGERVRVRATVSYRARDRYNFPKSEKSGDRTAQKEPGFFDNLATVPAGMAVGNFGLTRRTIANLEKAGGAAQFDVVSTPWKRELVGDLRIRDGKVVGSRFTWKDVK